MAHVIYRCCTGFEHNPDGYRDASLKLALSTDCKFSNLNQTVGLHFF